MYKRTEKVYKEISKEEARELIYEARYLPAILGRVPEEVVAYEKIDEEKSYRLFTVRDNLPYGIKDWDEDMLLIYVRSMIPEELTFS